MKKIFYLIIILTFNFNIYSDDASDDGSTDIEMLYRHNFCGVISNSINIVAFDNAALDFYDFTFKFEYQFFKRINNIYQTGFGLSIGDSISPGGFMTSIEYIYFTYNFFNRVHQKISYTNLIGYYWDYKFAIFEIGTIFSFINFGNYFNDYYYLSFLISPYIFIGILNVDYSNRSYIVGGFFECSFDVGKFNDELYSIMESAYCYITFGIEYRVGYNMVK